MNQEILTENHIPTPKASRLERRFLNLLARARQYTDPEIIDDGPDDPRATMLIGHQPRSLKIGRQSFELFIYQPEDPCYYPSLTATWKPLKPQPGNGRLINDQNYFSLSMLEPDHAKYDPEATKKLEQVEKAVKLYAKKDRRQKLAKAIIAYLDR